MVFILLLYLLELARFLLASLETIVGHDYMFIGLLSNYVFLYISPNLGKCIDPMLSLSLSHLFVDGCSRIMEEVVST